jgi:tetratricopeptide (TPR) repeat protein
MDANETVSFADKLEKLKNTWVSMETKVLAGRVENRWINLGTVIKLSSKERKEEEKELFQLQNCVMILQKVEKFDFKNFKTILTDLNKSIKIKNAEIISEGFENFHFIIKDKENWTEDRITDGEGWPAHLLRCYGKHPRELLKNVDDVDKSLRANVEPYEDLSDLSSNYIFTVGGAYTTGIYVIAPIYIRFEKFLISTNGKLEVNIKCHKSIEIENLKMNVILSSTSTNLDRFQLSFKRKARVEGDFLVMEELVERNLVGVKGARIYLFYKDDLIRTDWVSAIRPCSEEELREDIFGAVQRMKESISDVEKVLEEIDVAVMNGVINIENNVKDKSVWNDLGIYCIENGFYRQAERIYGRMIDTITKYEETKGKRIHKGLAFHNLGVALLYQNRIKEAKKMFEQAYEEDKLSYGVVEAERLPAREALRKFFKQ